MRRIFDHFHLCFLFCVSNAQFIYPDFNQTLGLAFNGNATTTTCTEGGNTTQTQSGFYRGSYKSRIIQKEESLDDDEFHNIASFGHRKNRIGKLINGLCSSRLRLTSNKPNSVGSVWYERRVPVITNQSKTCSYHRDQTFSLKQYKSCSVHGGDGFSFVIHGDANDADALGDGAEQLGYGGLRNSIAIEFDAWTNTGPDTNDIFYDHISIHSAGSSLPNESGPRTSLGSSRPVDLADGELHRVRIKYYPHLVTNFLQGMTANENLVPYLKDNGEGRRLGTLAIFLDENIEANKPNLSIPLNLSVLLDLPDGMAYIGFTASTGAQWENHDILKWEWCSASGCEIDKIEYNTQF